MRIPPGLLLGLETLDDKLVVDRRIHGNSRITIWVRNPKDVTLSILDISGYDASYLKIKWGELKYSKIITDARNINSPTCLESLFMIVDAIIEEKQAEHSQLGNLNDSL